MLFFISNTSPSLIGEPGECCEDMVLVRREHKVCCQSSGHISIHAAKKKDNYVYTSSMVCSLQPFLIFQNDEVFPIKDRIYCFHSGDFAILYFSQSLCDMGRLVKFFFVNISLN